MTRGPGYIVEVWGLLQSSCCSLSSGCVVRFVIRSFLRAQYGSRLHCGILEEEPNFALVPIIA